ncbi:2-phospho-L-lactate guanylyltransferase [Aeromicrobium sp.]|uniref:2-phospho-L-lactate guanylyltransferase n=1 Tax=Aeromicrobium sp. TaxID=1871063 RepID=UPI002FCB9093
MPIKPWDGAKSRLHTDSGARRALAMAFAMDALDAVLDCAEVGRVVVVTSGDEVAEHARSAGAVVISESSARVADPLGAAVRDGVAWAAQEHPDEAVAVIPADLPSLTSIELGRLLTEARAYPLAFVADANGDGTTILASQRPSLLRAGYGVGSAERHRSYGAVELQAPAGLRRDVDEFHELLEAQRIGVGPHTAAAIERIHTRASV